MAAEDVAVRTSTEADALVDARPRLPASADSLWDKATVERDRIADLLDQTIRALGLLVWVRKSKPGEYPLYVIVDNWRPVEATGSVQATERSSLKVTIEVEPYREHPLIYTVELKRQAKHWKSSFWELTERDLKEMARYVVRGGAKPRFFGSRVPSILLIIGAILPPLLWLATPKNRMLRDARRTVTLATLLGWGGLLGALYFSWAGQQQDDYSYYYDANAMSAEQYFAIAAGCAALVALAFYLAWRRPRHVAVPSQSFRTPRHEFLVDSWHVSVPQAGNDFPAFERRVSQAISNLDRSIEVNKEMHQKLSPRGFEERERSVLTKGQANAHVHIYPFGSDAFVGWDGYLNFAKWEETPPVSRNVKNGTRIDYLSLKVGFHVPSEFDLMELNALTELVHRALVQEIKAFLKEKEIEADLDFKIIRGDRDRALKEGRKTEKERAKAPGGYFA